MQANRTIATVIGFTSVAGRPFTCRPYGVIFAPARDGGYYLAMSTAGGDMYGGGRCVGGGATVELAADMVRHRWGFPGESVCSFDGRYIRR